MELNARFLAIIELFSTYPHFVLWKKKNVQIKILSRGMILDYVYDLLIFYVWLLFFEARVHYMCQGSYVEILPKETVYMYIK